MLKTARLGSSAVAVTALGFGGAPIGNLYHAVDDATATGAVTAAFQAGVRFFDTAPHYGLGLSERRLGRAGGAAAGRLRRVDQGGPRPGAGPRRRVPPRRPGIRRARDLAPGLGLQRGRRPAVAGGEPGPARARPRGRRLCATRSRLPVSTGAVTTTTNGRA